MKGVKDDYAHYVSEEKVEAATRQLKKAMKLAETQSMVSNIVDRMFSEYPRKKSFKQKLSDFSDKHAMFNDEEILALGLYPNDLCYKEWLMENRSEYLEIMVREGLFDDIM